MKKSTYSCNDNKTNCATVIASSCVPFTGPKLTVLGDNEQLACDANINDVIFALDAKLKVVLDNSNLTLLTKDCLDFDPATVTVPTLFQTLITQVCQNTTDITALQTSLNTFNVGAALIAVDLGCLAPDGAPCLVGTNTYALQALLNLFAAKLCDHETRITDLEP